MPDYSDSVATSMPISSDWPQHVLLDPEWVHLYNVLFHSNHLSPRCLLNSMQTYISLDHDTVT